MITWLPMLLERNKYAGNNGVGKFPVWFNTELNYISLLVQQEKEAPQAKAE